MGSFGSFCNAGVWNHLRGGVCEGCLCVCKWVLNLLTASRERQTTDTRVTCISAVLFCLICVCSLVVGNAFYFIFVKVYRENFGQETAGTICIRENVLDVAGLFIFFSTQNLLSTHHLLTYGELYLERHTLHICFLSLIITLSPPLLSPPLLSPPLTLPSPSSLPSPPLPSPPSPSPPLSPLLILLYYSVLC